MVCITHTHGVHYSHPWCALLTPMVCITHTRVSLPTAHLPPPAAAVQAPCNTTALACCDGSRCMLPVDCNPLTHVCSPPTCVSVSTPSPSPSPPTCNKPGVRASPHLTQHDLLLLPRWLLLLLQPTLLLPLHPQLHTHTHTHTHTHMYNAAAVQCNASLRCAHLAISGRSATQATCNVTAQDCCEGSHCFLPVDCNPLTHVCRPPTCITVSTPSPSPSPSPPACNKPGVRASSHLTQHALLLPRWLLLLLLPSLSMLLLQPTLLLLLPLRPQLHTYTCTMWQLCNASLRCAHLAISGHSAMQATCNVTAQDCCEGSRCRLPVDCNPLNGVCRPPTCISSTAPSPSPSPSPPTCKTPGVRDSPYLTQHDLLLLPRWLLLLLLLLPCRPHATPTITVAATAAAAAITTTAAAAAACSTATATATFWHHIHNCTHAQMQYIDKACMHIIALFDHPALQATCNVTAQDCCTGSRCMLPVDCNPITGACRPPTCISVSNPSPSPSPPVCNKPGVRASSHLTQHLRLLPRWLLLLLLLPPSLSMLLHAAAAANSATSTATTSATAHTHVLCGICAMYH